MDIALVVEHLVPEAQYSGSVTDNTKKAWDAIVWTDTRSKPNWGNLTSTWNSLSKKTMSTATMQSIQSMSIELTTINLASISLIRTLLVGTPTQDDVQQLTAYETRAVEIRRQVKALSTNG